jgi:hypothetical protein
MHLKYQSYCPCIFCATKFLYVSSDIIRFKWSPQALQELILVKYNLKMMQEC